MTAVRAHLGAKRLPEGAMGADHVLLDQFFHLASRYAGLRNA
jgi:hypothetical protein